jgi:superfamily II DNA or RNA helicase
MVFIYNDKIVVSKDDISFSSLSSDLTFTDSGTKTFFKKCKNGSVLPIKQDYINSETLFKWSKDNNFIIIQRGLLNYIKDYIRSSEVEDKQYKSYLSDIISVDTDINKYSHILGSITLRDYQLIACRKILLVKRCIIQSGTGSGKSEIMAAVIKIIHEISGRFPTTLVIEPTSYLVKSIADRLSEYSIPVQIYNSVRTIHDGEVTICHPTSVNNDLKKNHELLDSVSVMFCDECHHMLSPSFSEPSRSTSIIEYIVGLSASAISTDHVNGRVIKDFSREELKVIGASGPLVLNVDPKFLIERNVLANPVLLMMKNLANEYIPPAEYNNWHRLMKDRLQSKNRTDITCKVAKFFCDKSRKVLILVNQIGWAKKILNNLYELGLGDISRGSYGGGYFERPICNGKFEEDKDNVMDKYSRGDCKILVGTSHLYEGVDVPNLDVIILAYGGKAARLQLQGIGRCLRLTKTGKYAYLVDFTDESDGILHHQSEGRLNRYKYEIGVPSNRIFYGVLPEEMDKIFSELEH